MFYCTKHVDVMKTEYEVRFPWRIPMVHELLDVCMCVLTHDWHLSYSVLMMLKHLLFTIYLSSFDKWSVLQMCQRRFIDQWKHMLISFTISEKVNKCIQHWHDIDSWKYQYMCMHLSDRVLNDVNAWRWIFKIVVNNFPRQQSNNIFIIQ